MNENGSWIYKLIEKHAGNNPSQIFLSNEYSFKNITYSESLQFINNLKNLLHHAKVDKSAVALVVIKRGVEQALVVTALLAIGQKAMVVSHEIKKEEIIKLLKKLPFNFLILDKKNVEIVKNQFHLTEIVGAKNFINVSDDITFLTKDSSYEEKFNFSWLLLTSGSTGDPKAVMLSEQSLIQRTIGEVELFKIKAQSKLLNILPLSHDLGLNQLLSTIQTQSSLEIFSKKFAFDLVKRLEHNNFDGITGIPNIWKNIIAVCNKMNIKFYNRFYLTVSGGSLHDSELKSLKNYMPNALIYKTYGQTEAFRSIAETSQDHITSPSAGFLIKGVKGYLVPEDNSYQSETKQSQFIHAGDGCFLGYWMDSELTKTKLMRLNQLIETESDEMVVATGDYFQLLPDGRYQYLGRKDDLIKYNGRRFYLNEVESCILRNVKVYNVAVVLTGESLSHALNFEEFIAFIVKKDDHELTEKEIRQHCISELDSGKVPTKFIMVKELPLTMSGKIDRNTLLKHYLKPSDKND